MDEPLPLHALNSSTPRATRPLRARYNVLLSAMLALLGACTSKGSASEAPAPAPKPKPVQEPVVAEEKFTLPLVVPGSSARVVRFTLASGVEEREPVGEARRFSKQSTARVYAFLEVSNEGDKPLELGVAFEPEASDEVSTTLTLDIPARQRRWRTHAFMNATWPGKYRAVLVGHDDEELAVIPFELTP